MDKMLNDFVVLISSYVIIVMDFTQDKQQLGKGLESGIYILA